MRLSGFSDSVHPKALNSLTKTILGYFRQSVNALSYNGGRLRCHRGIYIPVRAGRGKCQREFRFQSGAVIPQVT